ncbi:polysaccharide biosynthesis protein [Winogradskyella jejuensis]|uniref:NDP-sugar epimerase, includes UDP-GlcNAc-inverting 4,6-dehydratase FlaA1 and capsular polysaccharide biosynthesis protein EpsC n=1 Tax=Winogradskyella jejuensis TaxID=1089305 RepID=A0A1M5MT21_9FLAO|nr:nucleoside-diphosphate sugar epimerase/dehydratase [Winogradskyella jejuensis]SHG80345.1 NDP-sugar epimerase, includes UDP-GlcNAc-inverting 4,6-dehydratase FlaA1 and capsular polysaccharide biosynthesis protein EpsC [Winogradskyella jejuensis]
MYKRFKNALYQVLESSKKRLDFKNVGYLPRWAILGFDTTILFISLIVTKLVVGKIKNQLFELSFSTTEFVIICVNIAFFILYRTYAGLIRHSTFLDAVRFLVATLSTLITILVVYYINYLYNSTEIIFIPSLLIYALISFCGLFLFRVIVKQIFEVYLNFSNKQNELNVLVYGTDENAIAIASALKSEKPNRFSVLGFIDKAERNKSKQILGLPIFNINRNIAVTLRIHSAQALILADKDISKEENIAIIDKCLDYNLKVYRAPLLSDIEENKNITSQIEKIQIEDILERAPIKLDNKLVAKEIFNKCVMVTGGAGSIGSEIVRQVAGYKPSRLIILDQAESPLYNIQLEIKNNFPQLSYEAVICDVRSIDKIRKVFKQQKPDVVYHAAAYKHVPLMENHPSEAVFSNVLGTKNVADLSQEYGVEKFVMVSTDKAVNPSNVMGASKRIAEIYVQALQEDNNKSLKKTTGFVTTRFGNVLGSNGSVVPLFKKQIEEGGPVTITHPDIIRYFMTISEACQLVLEAGAMGNGGEIFIFDMGKAVRIIDLAKKIIRLAGYTPNKDMSIKIIGLRPGEKLYEELLNDKTTTLPTYNEKIMIAKVNTQEIAEVVSNIEELIEISKGGVKGDIVKKMKTIVPEFVSMNSDYEKFDKTKEKAS